MKTVCGLCTLEYDDQLLIHRQGADCVPRLRSMLEAIEAKGIRLHKLYQEHADSEDSRESKIQNTLEAIGREIALVHKRIEDVARRVTLLEHPKMEKVHGMKK